MPPPIIRRLARRALARRGRRPARAEKRASHPATAVALLLAVCAGLILVAPPQKASADSSPAASTARGEGKHDPVVFTVGSIEEIDSLNPMLTVMSVPLLFDTFIYDSLTSPSSEDLSPVPGLAESWEHSDDGLTWTYHLRAGLTWSDGKPLTAVDAEYTLGRILAGGPGQGTWGPYLESVLSVRATDAETLVLNLKAPNAILPSMPIPIMPKHMLEHYPDDELADYPMDPEHLVSSGPFRLIEGEAGGALYRFAANPDNWRGPSHIDLLTWRFFKAEDTVMQALIKGDIDYTNGISALQAQVLARHQGVVAGRFDQLGTFREIGFNTGSVDLDTGEPLGDPNPAVRDPAFRAALANAIDRDAIVEKAFKGAATPLTSVMAAGFERFRWTTPADAVYDPEVARKKLDDAGYRVGKDGRRTLPDGRPIGELRFAVDSGDTRSILIGQLVREWMDDIGLTVRVEAMRAAKLSDVILSGNYDMFEWGWGIDDDPDSVLVYFTCEQRGLWSDSWYCSDEYERLYDEQKRAIDPQRRIETIKEIQALLYRDAPYIVTVGTQAQQAYRVDRFHGYRPAFGEGGDVLFDVDSYFALRPGPAPGLAGDGGSSATGANPAVIYGSIATALLGGAIVRFLWVRRRRQTAEGRE
ncbi:ABC transporter substrate-binding protein [Microbacterium sp. MYb64]|uniref:ABC transporter substrate-binding protein n=1 Tax=Microbacterium sp. MYb64 TaxID=1848691 RepID=UPI000CFBD5C8|nr:ABC transporter substrate-binding protein [Microbacterium sp. MYb64]PRB09168.1 hypothetical protein CQ044_02135 [Microbacterium sp. MYb64]